jgi:hypothetical protein
MTTIEHLRRVVRTGNITMLRDAYPSPLDGKVCTHPPDGCRVEGTTCIRTTVDLADLACEFGQLSMWTYLFDTYLENEIESISWTSIRHITRKGNVEFSRAFQLRRPGWANSMEPKGIHDRPQPMNIVKLATMHGQLDFLDYLFEHCGCDVNLGGLGNSPVCFALKMDIDDGIVQDLNGNRA